MTERLLVFLLVCGPGVAWMWWRACVTHPHDEETSRSEQQLLVRAFQIASVSVAVSCILWFCGLGQVGNALSIFPAVSLCVGLFAVTIGILGIVRYPRTEMVALSILSCVPPVWSVYLLLILHPSTL